MYLHPYLISIILYQLCNTLRYTLPGCNKYKYIYSFITKYKMSLFNYEIYFNLWSIVMFI